MKTYIIILYTILSCSLCFGQETSCSTVKKSFYYINVSIWGKNEYPIFMDAVATDFKTDSLCFKNTSDFFESLYAHSFYIPQMPNGNRKSILNCLGDTLGRKYLKDNDFKFNSIGSSLKRNSYSLKFKLATKEDVVIKVSKISGTFWIVDKSSQLLATNSNELALSDIKNISNCYIPYNIQISKAKKKLK